LYCGGAARPHYGTLRPGGRAIYRLDPPYEAGVVASLDVGAVTGPTPILDVRVWSADATGACVRSTPLLTAGATATSLAVPPFVIPGHEPLYFEFTATGAAGALGYQLDFDCSPIDP
jgi:hypothetical protein